MIDSNLVIDHLEEGIAISVITYLEAFQGVERSPNPEEAQAKFHAFAESILILPLSIAVAER